MIEKIEQETAIQKAGKAGRIIAKINGLLEPAVVQALYRASQAGVKIDLICRGICALRPGIPGVSDNIRVISIVDRFLEHSRIFYFGNGGDPQVYIGSADWMDRNLSRRVEVVFPIEPPDLKQRLIDEILATSPGRQRQGPRTAAGRHLPPRQPTADNPCCAARSVFWRSRPRTRPAGSRPRRSCRPSRSSNTPRRSAATGGDAEGRRAAQERISHG